MLLERMPCGLAVAEGVEHTNSEPPDQQNRVFLAVERRTCT
jgi:hypothetical protein